MAIKTHNVDLPETLEPVLASLAAILPAAHPEKSSLVWVFGRHSADEFQQDVEEVFALYPETRYALTLVVPFVLKEIAGRYQRALVNVMLVNNPDFFGVIGAVPVNCMQTFAGRDFLFHRKNLFVAPEMLPVYAEEAAYDYEFHDLRVEIIPDGIVHPLEKSASGITENREYGGVTRPDLQFVESSGNQRVNGRYQGGGNATDWYVGANPALNPETIEYVDEDVVFLGALHKHYGHFILESLSRLWFFLDQNHQHYRAVYISEDDENKYNEVFALFGMSPEKLLRVEKPTRFKSVIVPGQSLRLHDRYHIKYKETIDRVMQTVVPAGMEKIYFSKRVRNEINHRGIGESAVADIFHANGYNIVFPENLTIYETLSLLKGCRVFAASSGSNAHNAIFLRDGAEMICLNRSPHIHYPQTMIDRMKGLQTCYVDAAISPLPADWSAGPFLFGPNKHLLQFLEMFAYAYDRRDFIRQFKSALGEFIYTWTRYYYFDDYVNLIPEKERMLNIQELSQRIQAELSHLELNQA